MSLPRIAPYSMPVEVPAAKVSWSIDPARSVLLIHDMQNYFLAPFDRAATPITDLVANLVSIRTACRDAGIPVLYTAQPGDQDPSDRALLTDFWGPGLRADNTQTDIVGELRPAPDEAVLTKWRYSAFARSDLLERMRGQGRDQLLVTGIYGHIGVMTTCVDSFMRDVQAFLIADAIADFSRADHELAVDWVARRCGVAVLTRQVRNTLTGALTHAG